MTNYSTEVIECLALWIKELQNCKGDPQCIEHCGKELRKRLESRGTESADSINTRVSKASYELSFADQFDHVIVNDDLDKACKEAEKIVRKFLEE